MFTKYLSVLILFVGAFAITASAQPANDDFINAKLMLNASGTTSPVNIQGAGKEPGEPEHAHDPGYRSLWYKYTAPGNGVLQLVTNLSEYDTLLAVYEGTSLGNLTLVAQNDDIIGVGLACQCSMVTFGTTAGKTYYIAVDQKSGYFLRTQTYGDAILSYTFSNVVSYDNFATPYILPGEDGTMYTTTNVGASKEAGEPNHAGNNGGKSVWYKWTAPAAVGSKLWSFSLDSKAVSASAQSLFAIYTGSSLDNLTEVGRGPKAQHSKIVFRPTPGTTYYIAIDGYDSGQGANQVTGTLTYGQFKTSKTPDFDDNGRADVSVYRPSTGYWYLRGLTEKFSFVRWGANGDKPLGWNWDNEGRPDNMVFRPDTGVWWSNNSGSSGSSAFQWGISGDVALAYEIHDGGIGLDAMYPAIFRPNEGVWYIRYDAVNTLALQWGIAGDIPVTADFTGDAKDDLTVFRPSTGTWYIRSSENGNLFKSVHFGLAGDKPVPADYDGDTVADIAVFRPSTGVWYILRSSDGAVQIIPLGTSAYTPQPADYDGDGMADPAVVKDGRWWVRYSSNGETRIGYYFGTTNDIPVTAPIY